jgi:hypothetical protein
MAAEIVLPGAIVREEAGIVGAVAEEAAAVGARVAAIEAETAKPKSQSN